MSRLKPRPAKRFDIAGGVFGSGARVVVGAAGFLDDGGELRG
ncbi:MAG: hypothetical protein ACRD59_03465 [Candidatus Acidiferrales bacterium]